MAVAPPDPYAAVAPPVPADPYAAKPGAGSTPPPDPYNIDAAADHAHVDRNTAHALVDTESHGDPKAVSPVGAQGLLQLMPGTAHDQHVTDPFDPQQNLAGGLSYFHQLLVRFNGDQNKALAAYNAGPGNVEKYHGIPPFKETQDYVTKVNKAIADRMTAAHGAVVSISRMAFDQNSAPKPAAAATPLSLSTQITGRPQGAVDPYERKIESDAPQQVAAIRSRTSGVLQRIGNVGDDFTFAPMNAAIRDLGGDHKNGLYDYAKTLFNPNEDAGKTLDETAAKFGFNAPDDIAYWARQPGMRARINEAHPKTDLGHALQLSLGMRSDVARLKVHPAETMAQIGASKPVQDFSKAVMPFIVGAETAGAEFFNPAYLATGEFGAAMGSVARGTADAARAGKYGATAQKLAVLATKAPIAGNRFTRMYDAGGIDWEHAHAGLARDMNNAPHIAQDRAVSDDTFGGARIDDQVKIVHEIEAGNTGSTPGANRLIGDLTIADRARNVGAVIRNTENALRNVDPEMAGKLLSEPYFPHGGAWDLPQSTGSDAAWGNPSIAGHGGGSPGANVVPQGRIHDTLAEGQAAGLQMDPDWTPSGAMAMHQAKIGRYIALAEWVKSFAKRTTSGGKPGLMDIEYKFPLPGGGIQVVGTGAPGYERAMNLASKYGANRASAEATTKGAAKGWTQDQIDQWAHQNTPHYTNIAVDEMRKIFRSQNPDHDFDSHTSLGMPMLKGQALHNAAVDAAIDSHPTLRRLQKGEGMERFSIHSQDEAPEHYLVTWIDNVNSAVRQGLLANVGYHPTFNLLPLALEAGVSPIKLARAMALDPNGTMIPKALLDRAAKYNANAPKFGTSLSMDPHVRAKLLTVPYDGLKPAEMGQKAFISASRWNQDVTFGYFEDRIAAVTMEHYESQGMSPEAAARATRKKLGDYENVTPGERAAGMRNWQYFYTWMRGMLRNSASMAIKHPQTIMAPTRGIQSANQQQGDEGAVGGGGLSLRSIFGTDAQGKPHYMSVPIPQLHYGTDIMRLGSVMSGDPTEAAQVATGLFMSHLPPLTGTAIGIMGTALMPAEVPKDFDVPLWDKNAPNPGAMWLQAMKKTADRYAPGVIKAPVEAIAKHDPSLAIGAVGPSVYTSANSGPQSKAEYGASIDLRAALKRAHDAADHGMENMLYDLLNRVQDGDPLAVREAQRVVRELRPPRRTK